MKRALALAGGLALAACTAAGAGTPAAPQGPGWDFAQFEVWSWGFPVTSWRILKDGSGSWTETVRRADEAPLGAAPQAWHELAADPAHFAALEDLFRTLPVTAPDPAACKNMMTDAPYGTLRLTRGATTTEIAFNSGCMDDDYRAFMAVLKQADDLVSARGRAAPVSRTEPAAAD